MKNNQSPKDVLVEQMIQALEEQDQERFISLTWDLLQLNNISQAG